MSSGDAIVAPNVIDLHGSGVTISYFASDLAGQPRLTYHSSSAALEFSGTDEVRLADSNLGQLVSVTLVKTVDVGFTEFTVVLPFINLVGSTSVPVQTIGITALHRAFAGAIGHPQRTTYKVTRLNGSARQVQTL